MTEWLNVGKIVNTHGIRGEVRVMSSTDFPEERFKKGSELALFDGEKLLMTLKVTSHRTHKNFDLLTFEGMTNINDVEKFRNHFLKVNKDQLNELEDHAYYYHEIMGCRVVSTEGQEIGEVTEILATGANDVWEVTPSKGKKHYIPYIAQVVQEIDIEEKKIVIDVMEGMLSE
ncbi:ribosome maturation factor RimM [Chryseomicrobium palamuruense]|uniref:Ribosome maturation factor RimM n=1 Tax=Chryseomicrobium palamuruense TaxID=682973 RepID=A0ABV8UUM4_9BACL